MKVVFLGGKKRNEWRGRGKDKWRSKYASGVFLGGGVEGISGEVEERKDKWR